MKTNRLPLEEKLRRLEKPTRMAKVSNRILPFYHRLGAYWSFLVLLWFALRQLEIRSHGKYSFLTNRRRFFSTYKGLRISKLLSYFKVRSFKGKEIEYSILKGTNREWCRTYRVPQGSVPRVVLALCAQCNINLTFYYYLRSRGY